jgi:hypothetical protein
LSALARQAFDAENLLHAAGQRPGDERIGTQTGHLDPLDIGSPPPAIGHGVAVRANSRQDGECQFVDDSVGVEHHRGDTHDDYDNDHDRGWLGRSGCTTGT